MGLFTAPSIASRRPLKRRSLGGLKNNLTGTIEASGPSSKTIAAEPPPNGKQTEAEEAAPIKTQILVGAAAISDPPQEQTVAQNVDTSDEEDHDLDLADLESDNAFLYDRRIPLDEALGLYPLHQPELSFLEQIDAYVSAHYLDCFGITHKDEIVHRHHRVILLPAKAPRFLSIHSLKRKELERDFADVTDTTETCARKQLCQGRCLLGFACPSQDLDDIKDEIAGSTEVT